MTPDNKRIYRRTPNGYAGHREWTFYGAFGEKLGVFTVSGGPHGTTFAFLRSSVWFAGRLITEDGNPFVGYGTYSVAQDRLGTNRAGGARYYPYGEEIGTASANDRTKFATYTRDGFTGLDYADQRFYASSYGRFNTPDPANSSGRPEDPGTWNRFAYTAGDPVNRSDPKGLDFDECGAFDPASCQYLYPAQFGGDGVVQVPGCDIGAMIYGSAYSPVAGGPFFLAADVYNAFLQGTISPSKWRQVFDECYNGRKSQADTARQYYSQKGDEKVLLAIAGAAASAFSTALKTGRSTTSRSTIRHSTRPEKTVPILPMLP